MKTNCGVRLGWFKVVFALLAGLLAAGCIALVSDTEKAYAYGVNQTGATSSSISISWENPYTTSSSYKVTGYRVSWGTDYSNPTGFATLGAGTGAYTVSGLKGGTQYYIRVEYDYERVSTGEKMQSTVGSVYGSTRVVKPTGVKQTKWWYYIKAVDFTWNRQDAATGVQYKICKASNGKTVKTQTSRYPNTSFTANNLNNNTIYTVSMRVKDVYGWSAWSSKAYMFTQPMATSKTKATNGKLTIAWSKMSGATSYSVYVSTKEKSGYKKVGTVKSTKSKLVIKKFNKAKISKKKTYYVYVVANKKVGGKTYNSGKHYTYKVKGSSGSVRWTFD